MAIYQKEMHSFTDDFVVDTDKDEVFSSLEEVSLGQGEILIQRGQQADGIYFIVSGRLAVQKGTGFGERKQVVALLEKGAPVGEGGLVPGYIHGTTVAAVENSELLFLSSSLLADICKTNPKFGLDLYNWILGRLSTRLNLNTERLAHIL